MESGPVRPMIVPILRVFASPLGAPWCRSPPVVSVLGAAVVSVPGAAVVVVSSSPPQAATANDHRREDREDTQ